MRSNPAMLYPLFALAAWTLIVLVLIPIARVRSVRKGEIGPGDFRYGESAKVPTHVSLPNRNYMNLLELPMLFYVVGILLYVTGGASYVAIERERAVEVDYAQHDVVDVADPNHGHAPARWVPASTQSITSATLESVNAVRR